ncbi:unnamed protein product [Ambrosiozyma monospora]|uniref:Unnamed protein product n=1 Tax=Ambrosiozyma monospora TaxID=43982 RepID=A0A9W6YT46_AMBMO|nr:unnamed protein product [Ambrosiozyma monospora]
MVTLTRLEDDAPVDISDEQLQAVAQQLTEALDKEDEELANGANDTTTTATGVSSNMNTIARTKEEDDSEAEDSDAELEDSDYEDDFNENETILERLDALKDIIPLEHRIALLQSCSTGVSLLQKSMLKLGSGLWILGSSVLLLGVPLGIAIVGEQKLLELENQMSLQQYSSDLLTGESKEGEAAKA